MASAVDIITYVGVPLAVIGVLPTLFTFFRSIVTLRSIRHILANNHVTALTRSSVLSGIVELEIPRTRIAPLPRWDNRYFEINDDSSNLRGGSWTQLHWKTLVIGSQSYRIQYHDEVSQPSAEVGFEELVGYLLDRGALPDPAGFADLRSMGLWTPAGTVLLRNPSGDEPALRTGVSEDGEGVIGLVLSWRSDWDKRSVADLPPYWMRLDRPGDEDLNSDQAGKEKADAADDICKTDDEAEGDSNEADEKKAHRTSHLSVASAHSLLDPNRTSQNMSEARHHRRKASGVSMMSGISRVSHFSMHSHLSAVSTLPDVTSSVRLRLSPNGTPSILMEPSLRPLTVSHLLPGLPASTWFAHAATALARPHLNLWSFAPTPSILSLALTPSIPCGVLVLLGILAENASPTWRKESEADAELEQLEKQQANDRRLRAMMEESRLPFEKQAEARQKRMMNELREGQYARERKRVEDERRAELEIVDALASQRLTMSVVSGACSSYLISQEVVLPEEDIRSVVARVLWGMITSSALGKGVVEILGEWKTWGESGGMTKAQYRQLTANKVNFCFASSVLGLMAEELSTGGESSVVGDLQECLRMYKKVRVG